VGLAESLAVAHMFSHWSLDTPLGGICHLCVCHGLHFRQNCGEAQRYMVYDGVQLESRSPLLGVLHVRSIASSSPSGAAVQSRLGVSVAGLQRKTSWRLPGLISLLARCIWFSKACAQWMILSFDDC
jgi:hypothetical protein